MNSRRQIILFPLVFLLQPVAAVAGHHFSDRNYSYILYYKRTGPAGAKGSAEFISKNSEDAWTVASEIRFPWSTQTFASIIPVPSPAIHKNFDYIDDGYTQTYTNDNGDFLLRDGRKNLFQLAEESLTQITGNPLDSCHGFSVHKDVFVTTDRYTPKINETIYSKRGKKYLKIIRDIKISYHNTHHIFGTKYLLVRASTLTDHIPIFGKKIFKIGLSSISGFVDKSGNCPWIYMNIDNYYDMVGVSGEFYDRISRDDIFSKIFFETFV
jgi:hypothetical protein